MSSPNAGAPAPVQTAAPKEAPRKTNAGRGIAIAALVVASVALLLFWVPIINNFAAFLAVVGLVLGVIAVVIAAKRNGSKGLAIAAILISVVAFVGVLATQAAYSSALDDISAAVEDAADGDRAASEDEQAEVSVDALALGTPAEFEEYEVTVDSVSLDAADELLEVNEFNEEPTGVYVLAQLSVTYTGNEEGDPWIDLSTELVGADSRIYSQTTCNAVVAQPGTSLPTLTEGGIGTYEVCFDVPQAAVADAKIRVSTTFAMTDDAVAWNTK